MQIWLQGEYGPPHRGEAEFHANDDVHASVRTAHRRADLSEVA